MRSPIAALAVLLPWIPLAAQPMQDPCSAASTPADVQFTLAIDNHAAVFHAGEIIPLTLSFSSTTPGRYRTSLRIGDRSGRLGAETYCVEPAAPDPLASYFKGRNYAGGGGATPAVLGETAITAPADLNDWHTMPPGRYRVYAVSSRIYWQAEGRSTTGPVRSNTIDIEVSAHDPEWEREQLKNAALTVSGTSPDALHAARVLRFLNTQDSARQLAKLFIASNQQSLGREFLFGLFGSPYPQLVVEAMRAELAAPDHAITGEFIQELVNIEVNNDPNWDYSTALDGQPQARQAFQQRRNAHIQELQNAESRIAAAALARKNPTAHAQTLQTIMTIADDPAATASLRPALIAAWNDLPVSTQQDLIQSRWQSIASPEMIPVLRRMLAEPPPARGPQAMLRELVLQHLLDLDPTEGRAAIRKELLNPAASPSLATIKLLPPEDIAEALTPAVERIVKRTARDLDYALVERYADAGVLQPMQAAFEAQLGRWPCEPQSAMLRYFLRVAPEYGAKEAAASLAERRNTGCYRLLLTGLGRELPKVESLAIAELDDADPEVVKSAAQTLGAWGTADAEKPLWTRLDGFRREWAGKEDQLRPGPQAGSRAATLEAALVTAIGAGTSWLCPPEKLARLRELVSTDASRRQISTWTAQWKESVAAIQPRWFPEDQPTFALLQYSALTEEQLQAKVVQFPRGTEFTWLFRGPLSMEKQTAVFERVRTAAEQHGVTIRKN